MKLDHIHTKKIHIYLFYEFSSWINEYIIQMTISSKFLDWIFLRLSWSEYEISFLCVLWIIIIIIIIILIIIF